MSIIESFFSVINGLIWSQLLVPLLLILGCYFSVSSGFIQFTYFRRMIKVITPSKRPKIGDRNISPLSTLLISVGGRVGGGNIAGVGVAIALGGPGAVFWMWVVAMLGMATSCIECTLAQAFKRKQSDGSYRGGPAYSIKYGLGSKYKWLALAYSICLVTVFGFGVNAFQGNAVAGALEDSFGIDRLNTGLILILICGAIISGGLLRITRVTDILVPTFAIAYLILAIVVVLLNISEVPSVFYSIFTNAFGFEEAVGGGIGSVIANGVARGLFSNEAGLGSVPNVAAAANTSHPVSIGISQALSVFIDTIIVCSCTALIILLGNIDSASMLNIDGVLLTQNSLAFHFGNWAQYLITIMILMFSFSSIIYNYYLGENAISFFTTNTNVIYIFRALVLGILMLGALSPSSTKIFFFSDPLMGMLAIINLYVMWRLFPVFKRLHEDYEGQRLKEKDEPVLAINKFKDLNFDFSIWKSKQ